MCLVFYKDGKILYVTYCSASCSRYFLGVGSSLTNETTIAALHLELVLGQGTFLYSVLILLKQVGKVLFDNLPLIFAVSIALGMSKRRKEVAALAAIIAFL